MTPLELDLSWIREAYLVKALPNEDLEDEIFGAVHFVIDQGRCNAESKIDLEVSHRGNGERIKVRYSPKINGRAEMIEAYMWDGKKVKRVDFYKEHIRVDKIFPSYREGDELILRVIREIPVKEDK